MIRTKENNLVEISRSKTELRYIIFYILLKNLHQRFARVIFAMKLHEFFVGINLYERS
jgi:hypothetical protein